MTPRAEKNNIQGLEVSLYGSVHACEVSALNLATVSADLALACR